MDIYAQIVIKCEYGDFFGEKIKVTEEQYSKIEQLSRTFYLNGFEMTLEDGGFIILPPDVIKKSILLIKKTNN
jgi:hypothetical protein